MCEFEYIKVVYRVRVRIIVVYCCVVPILPDVTRFCSCRSVTLSRSTIAKRTVGADPAAVCISDEFCHQG